MCFCTRNNTMTFFCIRQFVIFDNRKLIRTHKNQLELFDVFALTLMFLSLR